MRVVSPENLEPYFLLQFVLLYFIKEFLNVYYHHLSRIYAFFAHFLAHDWLEVLTDFLQDRRFATLQRTLFIYLINKYILLSDICLTVHHRYK